MSTLLIWVIWSLGAFLGLEMVTWHFAMRKGRGRLTLFYIIFVPMAAAWKLHLTFTGENFDSNMMAFLLLLFGGTWVLSKERWSRVLSAFAVLGVANSGSEFIALGLMEDILGISVIPLWESQGALCCILLANGLCFLLLLAVSGIWSRSGKKRWVKQAFLLFFFIIVQNMLLIWVIYASYLNYIQITVGMLAGAGILVFGSFYFIKLQLHYEETKEMKARIREMELESQKEYEHYQQLEEKEKVLYQIRHDFHNHLTTAYYLAREGRQEQAKELLAEMEQAMGEEELAALGNKMKGAREGVSPGSRSGNGNLETETPVFGTGVRPEKEHSAAAGKQWRLLRPLSKFLFLPAGQLLLFPKMLQVFFEYKGTRLAYTGMVLVLLLLATDGIWIFLLIGQRKREELNVRFLEFQYMANLKQVKEQAARERMQEVKELRKELIDCLGEAKGIMQDGQEPEVFRGILLKVQNKARIRYCANELVNTVLEEKLQSCRRFQVRLWIQTEIPGELAVKSSHLCSVFTNLLDNGIQACRNMPAKKRWISVQSRRKEDYLYIRVSNPTSREYEQRPREIGRGLGKTIIARIVSEYQGEYWTQLGRLGEEEVYTAVVVLQVADCYRKP